VVVVWEGVADVKLDAVGELENGTELWEGVWVVEEPMHPAAKTAPNRRINSTAVSAFFITLTWIICPIADKGEGI
jgi:hypothetical protein